MPPKIVSNNTPLVLYITIHNIGDAYFELATKKRCTVKKWRKSILVDIREVCFYDVHVLYFYTIDILQRCISLYVSIYNVGLICLCVYVV